MNRITDNEFVVEILKNLLSESSKSKYSLEKKLSGKRANYPTLLRYINRLKSEGFITTEKRTRKNGTQDKRGTESLALSYKGLAYLILKADLDAEENKKIIRKLLTKPPFQRLDSVNPIISEFLSASISKTFNEIRYRINLDSFNENYFEKLLYERLLENFVNEALLLGKEFPEKQRKKLREDAKKIPSGIILISSALMKQLEEKKKSSDEKLELLEEALDEFKKGDKT